MNPLNKISILFARVIATCLAATYGKTFAKQIWNDTRGMASVGAVFGLLITSIVGAYTIPTAISSLINSTATGNGIAATSPVVPILSIVAPIVVAVVFLVILARPVID